MKTEQEQQKEDVIDNSPSNPISGKAEEVHKLTIFQNKVTTIFLSLIILLFVIFTIFVTKCVIAQKPPIIKIECSVQQDSLGRVSAESRVYCDSIVQIIKRHEQNFDDRYEFFLQQRENYQEYLAIGGFVLTVVVSVVGFMGYKSISTMEDRMKSNLERFVESKVVSETSNKVTKLFDDYNELSEKLLKARSEEFSNNCMSNLNRIKADVKNSLMDEMKIPLNKNKEDILNEVRENADRMGNLQSNLNRLTQRVNRLTEQAKLVTKSEVNENTPEAAYQRKSNRSNNPFKK